MSERGNLVSEKVSHFLIPNTPYPRPLTIKWRWTGSRNKDNFNKADSLIATGQHGWANVHTFTAANIFVQNKDPSPHNFEYGIISAN